MHIAITIFQVSFFLLEVKKPSTHFVAFRILESVSLVFSCKRQANQAESQTSRI